MTTTRTFTAEGKTFTTKAKTRYAVVVTAPTGIYCEERGYGIYDDVDGIVVAKRTNNYATAAKALARYAATAGFVSGSIADTSAGEVSA
jgi:hypothetical protein